MLDDLRQQVDERSLIHGADPPIHRNRPHVCPEFDQCIAQVDRRFPFGDHPVQLNRDVRAGNTFGLEMIGDFLRSLGGRRPLVS